MPKLKGETDQEWMERLRKHRERSRDEMFLDVAAARCWGDRVEGGRSKGTEFQAFMHIFHPDHALTGTEEGMKIAREMNAESRKW